MQLSLSPSCRLSGQRSRARDAPDGEVLHLAPVVFLELPVVILFALYPGLFSLSQLAR
jgi:hypothetical protein